MNLDRIRELRECIKVSGPYEAAVRLDEQSGELDAALAAAEALARLEAWLSCKGPRSVELIWTASRQFCALTRTKNGEGSGPTLLAALTAALDQAEGKTS